MKKRKIEMDESSSVKKETCTKIPYSYIQSLIQPQEWIRQHYSCTGSVYTTQEDHSF